MPETWLVVYVYWLHHSGYPVNLEKRAFSYNEVKSSARVITENRPKQRWSKSLIGGHPPLDHNHDSYMYVTITPSYDGGLFPVPGSCSEAQLRYGFPDSGLFWIDIDGEGGDYDALQMYCDMSTVPAATLLSHNREGSWMHSKNHSLHIDHVDTVEYSLDHELVCLLVFLVKK